MKYVDISKQKEQKSGNTWLLVVGVFFLVLLGSSLFLFRSHVLAIFNPITIVSTFTNVHLSETDGRTNVLILGSDKRAADDEAGTLTDTMLVASIGRIEGDVVMISLPRDLWVKNPGGYYSKINAVYENSGGVGAKDTVSEVLGIPIHYYAVMDFNLFKEAINTLGGVEVTVDTPFTDYFYPIEGKENAPLEERYETVKFEAGTQTMDGETALKFVRSRKGDNEEGTDFARSARQQKVIMAIKNKALSLDTLINPLKLQQLYENYSNNVDTDITLADIQSFYLLSQEVDFAKIKSIVLDDRSASEAGGLLYAPEDTSLYGGAYVLIPRSGNFSQLHAYVQRYIFGSD